MKTLKILSFMLMFSALVVSCGDAEKAADTQDATTTVVDEAAKKAADHTEAAADKVEGAVETAADKVEGAVETAAEKVEEVGEKVEEAANEHGHEH
ncbi:hypothetical protein [Aureispira anguillae]|uniref:Lipoprotein n=1 Tax=Aureispira anguillae TaxID=2864201 RepID=A0A915YL95_9BACT|nr:hypothetical protein [Aureispira anguillae]BDS15302.1 hypothetical protein AsAng_0060860 [Aureispira anguillae]